MKKCYVLLVVIVFCVGCAAITEDAKVLWGSSIQALERGRPQAIRKTFSCEINECYAAVLKFANAKGNRVEPAQAHLLPGESDSELAPQPTREKILEIFSKDPRRNVIVVMGITEHVNTTEAGIFFTASDKGTVVEVTSQSTGAKTKVAEMIFADLTQHFKELNL